MGIKQIKKKIEAARSELAKAEGQKESLGAQIDEAVEELREVLGCEPGGEKEALAALKQEITEQEEALEDVLDRIEASDRDDR